LLLFIYLIILAEQLLTGMIKRIFIPPTIQGKASMVFEVLITLAFQLSAEIVN